MFFNFILLLIIIIRIFAWQIGIPEKLEIGSPVICFEEVSVPGTACSLPVSGNYRVQRETTRVRRWEAGDRESCLSVCL